LGKVNIGVIGCGIQGTVLSRALTGIEAGNIIIKHRPVEDAIITAAADVNEETAKKFVKEFGLPKYFGDYKQLLEQKDVDAVIVALPHYALAQVAIDSLKAGKHVLLEKPMALNHVEGRGVVKAAERSKQKLMVGYTKRWGAVSLMMKRLLERNAVGEADVVMAGKSSPLLSGWLLDPEKGGGIMRYLGVHITDQVLWMMGGDIGEVYGQVNYHPQYKSDETDVFTIRFKNGLLANVTVSMKCNHPFDFIEVCGTDGTVRADWIWCGDAVLTVQSKNIREYESPARIQIQGDPLTPLYRAEVADFVDSIVHDKPSPVTAEEGLRVLEVVDAVYESSKTGKAVKFPIP
jgi:predicted dehydrogenase